MSASINSLHMLNIADSWGNTPLHIAAKRGDRKTVQLLMALGSNPSLQNNDKKTVFQMTHDHALIALMQKYEKTLAEQVKMGGSRIHAAVVMEDVEALSVLAKNEDVDAPNEEGRTALHLASLKNNQALLRKVFTLSKNLEVRDHLGYTPLALAALEGSGAEALSFLLKAGANPDVKIGDSPLIKIVEKQGSDKKKELEELSQAIANLKRRKDALR